MLTTTIVAPPSNASKWQMGFNSEFKGLSDLTSTHTPFEHKFQYYKQGEQVTFHRGLLVASRGHFSDKGCVSVASRAI